MRSRGVQRTATRTNFRIPFLARMLLNRLAPEVPNNIFKNPSFCSFVFFLIVLVTPFNKILDLQESEQFSLCHSFLYLKLLKLLSQNRVFSFEFLHQLLKQLLLFLMELKYFFAKRVATFINRAANLLNSHSKNPPD